jgi:enamidase
MSRVLLKNIGTLISGDISNPILKDNAILIEDGKIKQIGREGDLDAAGVETTLDCAGTTVTPGLFDSHCHVVLGDYTPRQKQTGFLESEVHGGVTTFISAGEVHLPGRPKDPVGTKALAILAAKSFANFRPGGGRTLRNWQEKASGPSAKSDWEPSRIPKMPLPWSNGRENAA